MNFILQTSYDWDFRVVGLYKEALLRGTWLTIQLTLITVLAGTVMGLGLALSKMAGNSIIRWLSTGIIEVVRAIPLLVLLIWLYYCLPILAGVRFPAFAAAAIGLSLNLAVFAAEVIRAGIQSIPRGYYEAGRSLGMNHIQVMSKIILPQATRDMLPAMIGLYVTMLKLTTLASVISVGEILHSANTIISASFRPLEVYTAIAFIYVALVVPITLLSRRLESSSIKSKPRPS